MNTPTGAAITPSEVAPKVQTPSSQMPPSDPSQVTETPTDPDHRHDKATAASSCSVTTLSDRTRPLITMAPTAISPPRRLRPLLLANSLIEVQLRKSLQGLSDPADDSYYLPPSQLLKEKFKSIQTKDVRCHHLSWDTFCVMVHQRLGIDIDLQKDELGWMQVTQLGTKYISIIDELTFHNAIGVLHNTSVLESGSLITVYLWSPRPDDPVFHRSRRARDVPGKQVGGAPQPTPPQHDYTPPLLPRSVQDMMPASAAGHGLPSDKDDPLAGSTLPPYPSSGEKTPPPPPSSGENTGENTGKNTGENTGETTPLSLDEEKTPEHAPPEEHSSTPPLPTEVVFDVNELLEQEFHNSIPRPEQDDDEDNDEFQARLAEYQAQLAENEVNRLQYELDSKVCEHLDEEIWQKVCAFFRHDPNLKSAEYVVKIKGFGRKLLPVQAHAVYWALHRTDGVHGSVILGHVMGLGKTTIVYAIHLVRHKLNCMHRHIEQNPKSHCEKGYSVETCCPMNDAVLKEHGMDCPCAPESPTHFTQPCYGFSTVMAPQGLMQVWVGQGASCFLEYDNPYQIEVMRAHKFNLSNKQLQLLEADRDDKQLDADGRPVVPRLYPKVSNSRCIVITTSHSFESKVKAPLMRKDKEVTPQAPTQYVTKRGQTRTRQNPPIIKESAAFFYGVISQVFRDEFHMERNKGSKTITVLKDIEVINLGPPHLICLSGTPLTTGPADLCYYIKAMVRNPEWKDHLVLRNWMKDEAIQLGKEWDARCRTGSVSAEASRACVAKFRPLVEELMVRFTPKSNFLGTGPVVKVPTNVFLEVSCALAKHWEHRLAQQKADEDQTIREREQKRRERFSRQHNGDMRAYQPAQQNRPNSYYRARLYASFPYLMDIKDENGTPLRLTEQEWIENVKDGNWKQETESDPYFANREEIFASSAKLTEIGRIWKKFKGTRDVEGQLARLIFCSYFFTGSYIMYLFFVYSLGVKRSDLVYFNKTMTQSQIDNCLEAFHGGRPGEGSPPRLLIATTSSFGVGQTLNEAVGLGLLEPDYRLFAMLQAFGRHCRQGNQNPKTWSWLFRASNNGVEDRITSVNKMRARIEETTEGKVGKDNIVIDLSSDSEI